MKIVLAKHKFMYYLNYHKEFEIFSLICRIFLIFFLLSVTFQPNVFADKKEKPRDIKEKSSEDYRLKGYEAQQKGNLEEALSYYAKAASLTTESDTAPIFNDMGVIYEQLGLTDKAEESYLEAVRLNDHYLPAYANLAYLYKREGDIDKAAQYFKKRIEWGDPKDIWTKKAKEELSELGKKSPKIKKWISRYEATQLSEEIVQKEREDFYQRVARADECYDKGQALMKAKKYDQALDEFNRALALTPQNPKIIRARNEARLESTKQQVKESADAALKMLDLGDTASAKIEFRKILTIIPDEPISNLK